MKTILAVLLFFMAVGSVLHAQISGKICHVQSGAPLANVNVVLQDTPFGTQSDSCGRFSLSNIPRGSYTLLFQHIGFKTIKKNIVFGQQQLNLNISLEEHALQSSGMLIESERWTPLLNRPHMSRYVVKAEEILNSTGSFEDPLKTVQSLPGVISRSDYTSNFYIRGSEPEQQAIVLDGLMLQNPYRGRALGYGSLSILNPDLVETMEVTLGGYSAAHGNRLGALVELNTRDGGDEWKHQISLNLLSARYSVGGPLSNTVSAMFSARRTYYDWVINKLADQTVAYPHFYDVFGKIRWNFSKKHILRVMAMFGGEGSRLANVKRFSGNFFTLSSNKIFYGALDGFLNKNLSYRILSAYQVNNDSLSMIFKPDDDGESFGKVNFRQFSTQGHVMWEGQYISANAGFNISRISQAMNIQTLYFNDKFLDGKSSYDYTISGLFIENMLQVENKLQIKLGLRWDYFSLFRQEVYSPRFNFKWQFRPRWTFSGSAGIFYQFPEHFNPEAQPSVHDNSAPSDILSPQKSRYGALGLNYAMNKIFTVNMEIYRKKIDNLHVQIVSKTSPSLTLVRIDDIGKSGSYGLELSADIRTKNLSVRPAYSLSKTIFQRSPTARWEPMYFDNEHWLSLKLDYRFLEHWQIHSSSKFASGFPHHQMLGWSKSGTGDYSVIPTDKIIRAAYFRWDIRMSYSAKYWKAYIEIINITNARNFDQYLNYYYKESNKYTLQTDNIYMLPRLPVFGFQLTL